MLYLDYFYDFRFYERFDKKLILDTSNSIYNIDTTHYELRNDVCFFIF